jgi:hypothetical protein
LVIDPPHVVLNGKYWNDPVLIEDVGNGRCRGVVMAIVVLVLSGGVQMALEVGPLRDSPQLAIQGIVIVAVGYSEYQSARVSSWSPAHLLL